MLQQLKTTSIRQLFHCQAHSRDDHKQTIDYLEDIHIFSSKDLT